MQWKTSLDADDIEKLLAGDLPHPRRAYSARDPATSGTIGGQQDRSHAANPLRRRTSKRLFKFYGATTGTMVRCRISTAKFETARAAEDRRSHRRSDPRS